MYCIHNKSLQELQVKFEPPDIMGIPPDPLPVPLFSGATPKPKGPPEQQSPQQPEEAAEEAQSSLFTLLPQPSSLPSSLPASYPSPPYSSLPSSLRHTPTNPPIFLDPFGEGFLSLPSQPATSTKLATPSEFLSLAQKDPTPSSTTSTTSSSTSSTSSTTTCTSSPFNHLSFTNSPPLLAVSGSAVPSSSSISFSSSALTSVTAVTSMDLSTASLDPLLTANGLVKSEEEQIFLSATGEEGIKGEGEEEVQVGGEEGREGGGGGGGSGREDVLSGLGCEASDGTGLFLGALDDVRPKSLQRNLLPTESSSKTEEEKEEEEEGGEEGREESGREEGNTDVFSSPFPSLQPTSVKVAPGDFTSNQNTPPSSYPLPLPFSLPLHPLQLLPSPAEGDLFSAEFVGPENKQLTPSREEGAEIVNTTGTPSAEYLEIFAPPRRGSGGAQASPTNEMVMSYDSLTSPLQAERRRMSSEKKGGRVSANGESAWPDVMAFGSPDNSRRRSSPITVEAKVEATPPYGEGVGSRSEVSEVGQTVESAEQKGGGGGRDGDTMEEEEEEEEEKTDSGSPQYQVTSARNTLQSEPTIPNWLPELPPGTYGETGQALPVTAEQATPLDHTPSLAQQESEEGGGMAEGREGEEVQLEGGGFEDSEGVKESTGTAASLHIATCSHIFTVPPEPLPLAVDGGQGGGKKGKGVRKRKSRTKRVPESGTHSPSDGEPRKRDPSEEANEAAGGVDHAQLTQLYQLVARQQEMLQQLCVKQERGFASLQQQLQGMQRSTLEEQQAMMAEHTREQQLRVDRALKEKQVLDRQRQDKLISTVAQTLTSAVNTKLERVVKTEMKNQVVPAVQRSMGSVQEHLSSLVQHKLTATNTALRETTAQLVQSKGLPEVIGSAVAGSLQSTIHSTYEEMFRSVVMPTFERSCQQMFHQIDEAFRRGTAEYLTQLQQHNDSSLQQLLSSYHSLHSLLSSPQSPLLSHIHQQMREAMQSSHKTIADSLPQVVEKAVETSIAQHAATIDRETTAKEERAKKEDELRRWVQSRDLNKAFEVALTSSDLSLVLYLCRQVPAEEVFDSSPCPLSQPVLLSLLQQLSFDLSDQPEIKIRYLEGCVEALDPNSDITKSHMTQVLPMLTHQLVTVESNQRSLPSPTPLLRQVKRLRMMTEGLLHPHK